MRNNLHAGHRKRLRDQFSTGNPDALPDHVLLELYLFNIIPRADTNPTAHRLLERFGSLADVFSASEEELSSVKGIGKATAAQIRLTADLFARMASNIAGRGPMTDPARRAAYVFPLLFCRAKDTVLLIGTDSDGRVTKHVLLSGERELKTVLRSTVTQLKEAGSAALILAHAHGCDILKPSPEDREATLFVRELAEREGMPLLAHYLVGKDGICDILPEVIHG